MSHLGWTYTVFSFHGNLQSELTIQVGELNLFSGKTVIIFLRHKAVSVSKSRMKSEILNIF
jgi:hypothetical protein